MKKIILKKHVKSIIIYSILVVLLGFLAAEFLFGNGNSSDPLDDLSGIERLDYLMADAVTIKDQNPVVGIACGTDYGEVTEEAIKNAGGLDDIIDKGDVVLIKPNLCYVATPDSPCTTDYRVVAKIAEIAFKCGAEKVIIAEGNFSGNAFGSLNLYLNLYDKIENVEFFNINDCEKEDCYELLHPSSLIGEALYIPKIYMDADVVITVPKLKTHQFTDCIASLSLKNQIGIASSSIYGNGISKVDLHSSLYELEEIIVELNKVRRPDFSVIDGIIGGEGYGPTDNKPVESNVIIAGRDIVAVDTVALEFMCIPQEYVIHVTLAGEQNMGISDMTKINIIGEDIDDIKIDFKNYAEKIS